MKLSKLILMAATGLFFYRLGKSRSSSREARLPVKLQNAANDAHQIIRKYAEAKQVRYISISKKIYYAKDGNGQPVIWTYTLADSMAALPAEQYFQLGRGCIVHRSIIGLLEASASEGKLCVVLADPFNARFDVPINKIQAFKLWWSQGAASAS